MKKIILILFLITLPSLLPYFNSRFFYTQDYIFIARLQQVSVALSDGQFPVRWAPDLRFGEPIFNFYASLPFYLGFLINLLGFDYIWTAKILFMLSSFLSAITMFVFVRKLFSEKAAYFSSVIYVWAPYRAVDMYVRGAIAEAWAFVFFPLIFYASLLVVERRSHRSIAFLGLSISGLFLTHNVTSLMFMPFLGLWWLYLIIQKKNWKLSLSLIGSFILGIGISSFFLLPALAERQFIQTKYLIVGYFDFRAHFVALKQFFSTFWGYGSSLWGLDDGLSFQIGLANWGIIILAGVLGFVNRKNKKLLSLFVFLGFSFTLSLFFQHNKSAFIWEAIPSMAFIQFPWRFLSISVFITAIIGGLVIDNLKYKSKILYLVLLFSVIFFSFSFFKPKEYVDDSFFDKFINIETMRQGVDLTKDYLPVWVATIDGEVFNDFKTETGEMETNDFKRASDKFSGNVVVKSKANILAPITYFPGWQVWVNGKILPQQSPSSMGLISFELLPGSYKIDVKLTNTPIRSIGNILSLISIGLVVVLFL